MRPAKITAATSRLLFSRAALFTSAIWICALSKDSDQPAYPNSRIRVFLVRIMNLGYLTLRKQAYSNILKILQPKKGNFPIKNSDIFHFSAQNIDCGYSLEPPRRGDSNEYHYLCFERRGGSNEYPQSMF